MFSTIGNVVEAFSINRGLNLGKPPEPPARVGGKRVPGTVEAQSGRTGTPHRPLREDPAPVQIKEAQQLDEQRACEFLPTDNTPHPVPYSKLSRSAATELKSKSDNRAATREDVYRLEW